MGRLERKLKYLTVQAKWDKCQIPVFLASARGRQVPLLKTLLSSYCVNECKYCAMRRGRRIIREKWSIDELVDVAMKLWKKGRIVGVFLSSSVEEDPELVVQREVQVAEELRRKGFTGYIHLRLMPGTPRNLIKQAARVADRIGVNIEAPRMDVFSEVCPDKGDYWRDIVLRLKWCAEEALRARAEGCCKGGASTQLIVGIGETDLDHLIAMNQLIRNFKLKRIYFSSFTPIPNTPLEGWSRCPRSREYKLYQASFLMRDYKFTLEDLKTILNESEMLPDGNLKLAYAKANPNKYPVNLANAKLEEILKVPGIGPKSARKILKQRREGKEKWSFKDLVELIGVKRAKLAVGHLDLTG